MIDDSADETGLIEIQRPESQNVKGRAGSIYRQRGLRGTFFRVKNSLYGVCVCVCPPRLLSLLITVMLKPYNKSLTQACSDDLKVTLSLSASRFAFSILTSCLGRGPPEVPSEAERWSPAGQPSYL